MVPIACASHWILLPILNLSDMPLLHPIQTEKINEQLQRINNELMSAAIGDDTGLSWPVPYYESTGLLSFKTTIDIFNGNSGIALYFIALFEYSGKKEDLQIAEDIMRKVLKSEELLKPRSFGFYTGLTGVIYTCIRLYELNKKKRYLNIALRLSQINRKNIIEHTAKADLLSGYSGSLFVFTLLYHHLKSDAILTMIKQLVNRLVQEARISETGLKWDYNRSKSAFDSLAGFSHGASGIAYALMQVGNYFKNDGLIYLAEQALQYEMQYFHQESNNWLDLRLGSYRLGLPDAHKWDLKTFLPEMKNVNSWAHGAAGIGLSRLYAWQISKNPVYFAQCRAAMNRCLSDLEKMDRADFSLCSGYSGMIPFLLRFQELGRKDLSKALWSIVERASHQYEREGSYNTYISAGSVDFGLLSGKAGIGYMLLQLLNPEMNNAIYPALPIADDCPSAIVAPDKTVMQQGIFSLHYPKTIQLMNLLEPGFTEQLHAEDLREFEEKINQKINLLSASKGWEMMEVFRFEKNRSSCWKIHKGYLCYAKKNEFINNQNKQLLFSTDDALLDLNVALADHVRFYPIASGLREIMELKQGNHAALFVSEELGLQTIYIGQLPALILSHLDKVRTSGRKLIDFILDDFLQQGSWTMEHEALKQRLLLQIRLLIRNGIISVKV
jgi:hypothetical protein